MPVIEVKIAKGRSVEAKRALALCSCCPVLVLDLQSCSCWTCSPMLVLDLQSYARAGLAVLCSCWTCSPMLVLDL